jgi:mycofactocin system creatininase family protein
VTATTRLGELASPALAGHRPVLVVPLGSCEQHGPHLPLGTDTFVAAALAQRLAERSAGFVVAPPVAISASGEHAGFAGTLSIGTDVTAAVLVEIARSAEWASGMVIVNGHGGNAEAVDRAVATIRAEGRNVLAWWPRVPGGDAHAGRTETSLMMAIEPALVDVRGASPGELRPLAEIAAELRTGGVRSISPSGVLGDPTDATLEHGRDLLDILTDDLVTAVDEARRSW